MSTSNSLIATQPHINATVSASAGSGKTWLLVTRIIKLLLNNAEPGNILALTFTRKAASEMHLRLYDQLYAMATANDSKLIKLLEEFDVTTDKSTLERARTLYESVLHAPFSIRLRTFHSFCQEILSQFPLEADIPPGFELLEDTSLLEQQACDSLFTELSNNDNGSLLDDLDCLMQMSNGPANTRKALFSMLNLRTDWWAYTLNRKNPAVHAINELRKQLKLENVSDPVNDFFCDVTLKHLQSYAELLALHKTKTNLEQAKQLEQVIRLQRLDRVALNQVQAVLLTANNEPRKRKSSQAQQKSMGLDNEERFLNLHDQLATCLITVLDTLAKIQTLEINSAWYRAGHQLIDIFQKLKYELRMLDFADLEWKCFQLLNTSDNALWVQYKTDQRIDHLLIDEFQDTNPTQWQLIKPVLEEMAANNNERWRTVFLVGDKKQSIYSFRRANPELQSQASSWLQENLSATGVPLDYSWRSSPAIINFVNRVFSHSEIKQQMPDFTEHNTHLATLPGSVTLYPLFEQEEQETQPQTELRNPLLQPRPINQASAYLDEAEAIAQHILKITTTPEYVHKNENGKAQARAIEYGDIMILLRTRNQAAEYETALRKNNIPFISDQQGTLLDNLEIQDLERLLEVLATPFDNLAVAQILKSPIFDATDNDLVLLAQIKEASTWYEKLHYLPESLDENHPLKRASVLLPQWHELVDTVPVHDLLDKIYAQASILLRYKAASHPTQQLRVEANLQRFLELSLELDSGRYPSLSHFLYYLRSLKKPEASAPDEPVIKMSDSRVRLMTIHSSKGLEAPVVFLADCNRGNADRLAYSALVHWPSGTTKPDRFQLLLDKKNTDSLTRSIQDIKYKAQQREQLNLLYVALTRAKEHLIITGVESRSAQHQSNWYSYISQAMTGLTNKQTDQVLSYRVGEIDPGIITESTTQERPPVAGKIENLAKPVKNLPAVEFMIAPSKILTNEVAISALLASDDAESGQFRGRVIHRALDLLTQTRPVDRKNIIGQLSNELTLTNQFDDSIQNLEQYIQEAINTVENIKFADIFNPPANCKTYNELPVLFNDTAGKQNRAVYGIIDRLIVDEKQIILVDYKTHRANPGIPADKLAASYINQLNMYETGVSKIWPDHRIRKAILLTDYQAIIWLDEKDQVTTG